MIERIHKNCQHFKDGWCQLKKKAVEAIGSACSFFKPKKSLRKQVAKLLRTKGRI